MSKKAIRIEVTFDDGSQLLADESNAAECWDFMENAQVMSAVHGFGFRGKPMFDPKEIAKTNDTV